MGARVQNSLMGDLYCGLLKFGTDAKNIIKEFELQILDN
jgi:hypothetical protein